MISDKNSGSPSPDLQRRDRHRQKVLGAGLRRLYEGAAAEPVLESLLDLLEQADQRLKT